MSDWMPVYPKAWIGLVNLSTPKVVCYGVRLCSWCPDIAKAEAMAKKENLTVSHGLCPSCYDKQIAQLLGEKE